MEFFLDSERQATSQIEKKLDAHASLQDIYRKDLKSILQDLSDDFIN